MDVMCTATLRASKVPTVVDASSGVKTMWLRGDKTGLRVFFVVFVCFVGGWLVVMGALAPRVCVRAAFCRHH